MPVSSRRALTDEPAQRSVGRQAEIKDILPPDQQIAEDPSEEEHSSNGNSLKQSVAFVLLAAVAASAAPSAPPQDAKTLLLNASKAMGADNLKTIQYSGTGTEFAYGQAYNPDSPWPPFADKSYTRTIDYEPPAWRVDRVLDDIPPDRRGGGLPPGPTSVCVATLPGAPSALAHAPAAASHGGDVMLLAGVQRLANICLATLHC